MGSKGPPRSALAGALLLLSAAASAAPDLDGARRGEYLLRAGGCVSCHTEKGGGAFLAGGRALKTDFGVFYGPNITPDPSHGIGRWRESDFRRALQLGRSPDGGHYFPSFPYPSFTRIADDDVRALWAYLRTVPPVPRPNKAHELRAPFGWRFLVRFWKFQYFLPGPFREDPRRDSRTERGRYLSEALGHCGECHTPRDPLGGLRPKMRLAGSRAGPEGEAVPNVTPDPETGLGRWSAADVAELLRTGMTRDGDFVGGSMAEVVEDSTSRLTNGDRLAIAAYLRSVPAVRNEVGRNKRAAGKRGDLEW